MFDHLQNKFSKIFKIVKGHGKITEKNISDSVREIRIALLESDVNFKIVSSFISKVKDKASGEKVFDSITPGQQFIKIVLDELIAFLSSDDIQLNLSKNSSTKLIVAGLFLALGLSAWGGILFFVLGIMGFYLVIPFFKHEKNFIICISKLYPS